MRDGRSTAWRWCRAGLCGLALIVGAQESVRVRAQDAKSDVATEPAAVKKAAAKAKAKVAAVVNPPKTFADVPYGPDPKQVLDFWKAESVDPAPLVVFIHGGGWTNGTKDRVAMIDVKKLLSSGISVASVEYRFVPQADEAGIKPPVKWPLEDAARAIQFLKSKASEWNIDPAKVAACGGSAGACSSLWLAFHDDMAQPESTDPVARQSTRLACAAVLGAQTGLDPHQTREWMPNMSYGGHAFGFRKPGLSGAAQFQAFYDHRDEVLPWIKEYSPIEHAGSGDPPIFMDYPSQTQPPVKGERQKDPTHSALLGLMLLEKLKDSGVETHLVYPGHADPDYKDCTAFLLAKLRPAAAARP